MFHYFVDVPGIVQTLEHDSTTPNGTVEFFLTFDNSSNESWADALEAVFLPRLLVVIPLCIYAGMTFGRFSDASAQVYLLVAFLLLMWDISSLVAKPLIFRRWKRRMLEGLRETLEQATDTVLLAEILQCLEQVDPRLNYLLARYEKRPPVEMREDEMDLGSDFNVWIVLRRMSIGRYGLIGLMIVGGLVARKGYNELVHLICAPVVVLSASLVIRRQFRSDQVLRWWTNLSQRTRKAADETNISPLSVLTCKALSRARLSGAAQGLAFWTERAVREMLSNTDEALWAGMIDRTVCPIFEDWFGGEIPEAAAKVLARYGTEEG